LSPLAIRFQTVDILGKQSPNYFFSRFLNNDLFDVEDCNFSFFSDDHDHQVPLNLSILCYLQNNFLDFQKVPNFKEIF
jgi:hypothetical protein